MTPDHFIVGDRVLVVDLTGWSGPSEVVIGTSGRVEEIGTTHVVVRVEQLFDARVGFAPYRLELENVLERLAREV